MVPGIIIIIIINQFIKRCNFRALAKWVEVRRGRYSQTLNEKRSFRPPRFEGVIIVIAIVIAAESFHTLVNLVSEFPSIKEKSHFVFVPGPRDPGLGPILPR